MCLSRKMEGSGIRCAETSATRYRSTRVTGGLRLSTLMSSFRANEKTIPSTLVKTQRHGCWLDALSWAVVVIYATLPLCCVKVW